LSESSVLWKYGRSGATVGAQRPRRFLVIPVLVILALLALGGFFYFHSKGKAAAK